MLLQGQLRGFLLTQNSKRRHDSWRCAQTPEVGAFVIVVRIEQIALRQVELRTER